MLILLKHTFMCNRHNILKWNNLKNLKPVNYLGCFVALVKIRRKNYQNNRSVSFNNSNLKYQKMYHSDLFFLWMGEFTISNGSKNCTQTHIYMRAVRILLCVGVSMHTLSKRSLSVLSPPNKDGQIFHMSSLSLCTYLKFNKL